MRVEVLQLEDIDYTMWNKFVMEAINSSVFNTIEWAKVWKLSLSNAHPIFILLIEDNEIQCSIPLIEIRKLGFRSYYSMPYGDYGGILVKNHSPEVKNYKLALIDKLNKLAKGRWGMVAGYDFYGEAQELEACGFDKIKYYTHMLTLGKDYKANWSKLDQAKRRSVKQAEKRGVEVSLVKNEQDVIDCYKMLEDTAKRHNKRTPKLSIKFYINIFNEMGKFLLWTVANKGENKLATTINFVFKDTITYWDGGSYTSGLQYRPNDALIWYCIRWGSEHGYKYYNLGGAPAIGLVRFKEQLGAEQKSYWCYYKKSKLFGTLKLVQQALNLH